MLMSLHVELYGTVIVGVHRRFQPSPGNQVFVQVRTHPDADALVGATAAVTPVNVTAMNRVTSNALERR
jgi:hypothetical protein